MTRNGKIARLPYKIREEINHRLRDNVAGAKICKWVNRLPAARVVCAEFAKRSGKRESPINEKQLSEWRRGGFQDWMREQQVLDDTREMAQWSMRLARDNGGKLSEGVAVLLSGQLLRLLQGMACLEKFQVPIKSEIKLQASKRPSSREIPSSKIQNRTEDLPEPCAPGNGEVGNIEHRTSNTEHRMSERSEPRAEGPESEVRLLGALVKCLSGIRRGDQNRVQLAQTDRKLGQRDKMIALDWKKYEDEQAEIAAEKQAEEKKKRRASRLSERTKVNVVRGKLFGPEDVIKEREDHLQRLQKELDELKAELRDDESSSDGGEATDGGSPSEPGQKDASGTDAPSGSEHMSVNPSPSDQLQEKNGSVGEPESDLPKRKREEAEGQG